MLGRRTLTPACSLQIYTITTYIIAGFSNGQIHLEIYGAIEIHVEIGQMSAPGVIVHKYQCNLPVQRFAAVLFEPEHHRDGIIRLARLYITRQDRPLTRHSLYRLHRYWNTHRHYIQKCLYSHYIREKKNNEAKRNRRIKKNYGFFRQFI